MMYLVMIFSSLAFADAVEMPPPECPVGSYGTSSHAGSWCQASTCESTSDCEAGENCQEHSLCIEESEVPCGGGWNPPDTAEECLVTKLEAFGPCNSDGSCDQGTCITDMRCVDPDELNSEGDSGSPKEDSCGGCSTGSSRTVMGLSFLVLAGVLISRKQRSVSR
jgi:hypothetical protein